MRPRAAGGLTLPGGTGGAPWKWWAIHTLMRPGDWLVLGFGLALLAMLAMSGGGRQADRVLIKLNGRTWLDTNLRLNRLVDVPGPLGVTEVEIRDGRVRVKSDPGLRQLCVRQGWIAPGEAAICLPNRVSVELGVSRYDSLNY
jgi:hypothetical protein